MTANPHPHASLYVGDLLPDVKEDMLYEIFNAVGSVVSIRVCRDTFTRRSLGYAYVNFHSVVDAERALDTLNNTSIHGKICRIMWSQRDPTIRKSGLGNIFIKNLDPSITHKELFDTFSAFGNILSCKVAQDENGNSKGFGFVHFENAEVAENAIKMVNGMKIGSMQVYVGKFVPKKERLRLKESSWTNVYIKDLDPEVKEEELKNAFSKYGPIQNCCIMVDENGKSKGFAFVNFEKHEDAVKAVEELHNKPLGPSGKKIWCGRAQKKAERESELKKKFEQIKLDRMNKYQGVNLYIKNLEDDIDEERLVKEFKAFGQIKSVKIMSDDKENSRGFGFICYNTPEEAQRAITEMNSRILQGCTKPLYVALHEPKEIRRAKLSQRNANRSKGLPMTGSQMYNSNGQVYYPHPAGFYPSVIPPKSRWAAPPTYPQQLPPNFPNPNYPARGPTRGGRVNRRYPNPRPEPAVTNGHGPIPVVDQSIAGPMMMPELTLQMLENYPFEQKKLLIGERLFPLVQKVQPELAGKITGMLLDSGWAIEEIYSLIHEEDKLRAKIGEAVDVLRKANEIMV